VSFVPLWFSQRDSANIRVLYDQAKQLARKLEYFEIKHVLRGGNKDADRLANEAMDSRKSSTV